MVAMLGFAALLVALAVAISLHQWAAFREARSATADEADLFVYSRRRLSIRLAGALLLAAVGVTLAVWELAAPLSPAAAQRLVSILITEVLLLVVVALLDLRETAKGAKREWE